MQKVHSCFSLGLLIKPRIAARSLSRVATSIRCQSSIQIQIPIRMPIPRQRSGSFCRRRQQFSTASLTFSSCPSSRPFESVTKSSAFLSELSNLPKSSAFRSKPASRVFSGRYVCRQNQSFPSRKCLSSSPRSLSVSQCPSCHQAMSVASMSH